jgi:subtilisin family serine protease
VAGVAAAAGNDGVGIAGMCWQCRILPVKVLNSAGSGSHSNIAAGIVWATTHGADVINLSLAGPYPSGVVQNAVNFALRHGVVVVAAAGNEGSSRRFFPAAYPGVISVGASTGTDGLYDWSNRGSWVNLAAPGCAYTGKPGAQWSWWCGTSFATPMVAGIAALVRSANSRLSTTAITRLLLNASVNVRGVTNGRIDALRAVRSAGSGSSSPPPSGTTYDWQSHLDRGHQRETRAIRVSGHEHVHLQWSTNITVWLTFFDTAGHLVKSVHGSSGDIQFQLSLNSGQYRVTVGTFADTTTAFRVRLAP